MKVYIAGAMSDSDPIKFLENLRRGIRVSAEALLAGYSVFSPFIDFQMFLSLQGDEKVTGEMIKKSSMEWMLAADAILLVPGWTSSKGTKAEIKEAKKMGIPCFFSLEELNESIS